MLLTTHVAFGGLIGVQTKSISLAFIFSVITHFILDMIPHGEEGIDWEEARFKDKIRKYRREIIIGVIDAILAEILILYFLLSKKTDLSYVMMAAIFGALLPDLCTALYIFSHHKILKKINQFHNHIHKVLEKYFDPPFWVSIMVQAGLVGLILVYGMRG
jgi:hypothetical protein